MKTNRAPATSAAGLALAVALILVAVRVAVNEGDPEVMSLSVLPVIIIAAIVAHIKTRTHNTAYRWAVRVALTAAFLLFWLIGGVGVLGSDDHHPGDLLYIGVFAVGVIGAIIARFQPRGMSRASFATALVQLLVPVMALTAGMHQGPIGFGNPGVTGILILNGFFAAMFVGSALLFRSAVRERTPAGAALVG